MQEHVGFDDDRLAKCREALSLWLAWNDRYLQLAATMYAQGQDQRRIEQLGDELDELRQRALEASKSLLAELDSTT